MFLSSLTLKDYRSYRQKALKFSKPITIIVGANAVGKTNILEAIALLALGRSFRTGKDEEMIHFEAEFGRVSAQVDEDSLEVLLTRGIWQGKKVAKKRFLINGTAKRRKDFISFLNVVLFEPQDLQLIIGSPSHKRNYLDMVLSQTDNEYDRSLLAYQKGLRQRNKVLEMIRERKAQLTQLEFWNRLLIKNGDTINQKRRDYIDYVNRFLSNDKKEIFPNTNMPTYVLEYKPSPFSPKRLQEHLDAEIAIGNTLIGPHRDDFIVWQKNGKSDRDLATYGSRGEQRLAVLALKLCEIEFLAAKFNNRPLLLLDDIFSELDSQHDQLVMQLIGKQQTIVTTTDPIIMKSQDVEIIELNKA